MSLALIGVSLLQTIIKSPKRPLKELKCQERPCQKWSLNYMLRNHIWTFYSVFSLNWCQFTPEIIKSPKRLHKDQKRPSQKSHSSSMFCDCNSTSSIIFFAMVCFEAFFSSFCLDNSAKFGLNCRTYQFWPFSWRFSKVPLKFWVFMIVSISF